MSLPVDPLFYFPERYARNRSFLQRAVRLFGKMAEGKSTELYAVAAEFLDNIYPEWQTPEMVLPESLEIKKTQMMLNTAGLSAEERVNSQAWKDYMNDAIRFLPRRTGRQEDEIEALIAWLYYHRAGKNIFYFPQVLLSLFEMTLPDDLRFEDFKLPVPHLYLSFGMQPSLPLTRFQKKDTPPGIGQPFYVDGVYVFQLQPRAFQFLVTGASTEVNYQTAVSTPKDFRFPVYDFYVDFSQADTEDFTLRDARIGFTVTDQVKSIHYSYEQIIAASEPGTEQPFTSPALEDFDFIAKVIRLTVNALAYLSAAQKETLPGYSDASAQQLFKQIQSEKRNSKKAQLQQKLDQLGATRFHYCGEKLVTRYQPFFEAGQHKNWKEGEWWHPQGTARIRWQLPGEEKTE